MSRKEKLYEYLDELETEFRRFVIKIMKKSMTTGSHEAFEHSEAFPFMNTWFYNREPMRTVRDLGHKIEKLRTTLGENENEGIVAIHKKYAIDFYNWDNEHRLGPKRLAEKFLREIGELRD